MAHKGWRRATAGGRAWRLAAIRVMLAAGLTWAAVASSTAAQTPKTSSTEGKRDTNRSRKGDDIPPAYRPPPGMCRIWLDGVPPNQQPAPTDCTTAVRNRPSNGRVIFGDDYAGGRSGSALRTTPARTVADPSARGAWRRVGLSGPRTSDDEAFSVGAPVSAFGTVPDTAGGRAEVRDERPVVARPVVASPPRRSDDDWEAGYAAGYRDAMNGRRPRVRGVDRANPNDVGTSYGTGYGPGYAGAGYAGPGYAPGYGPGYGGAPGTGAVVVVPPGQDPRYFNNGRYPPPGRANGVCLDRDGDGWCDDPRFGAPVCRDLDGDGRCDDYPALAAAPFPSSLPEMRAGFDVQQGRGSAAALRWLGTSEVVARVVNPKRAGTPYRILWYDANTNALLQAWTDLDGDGVADRVEIFRNGRRVKLLGR